MRDRHAIALAGPQKHSPFAMILGFVPVILFTVTMNVSQDLAIWAAFAAAFAIAIRDFLHEKLLRLLDAGSTVLFGLLAFYAGFVQPGLTVEMTRLIVDAGFLALALVSMALRNPVTLEYAREQAPREQWRTSRFLLTNYGLTAFWAMAFGCMSAADALANFHKNLPPAFEAAISLVVLLVAVGLTARYPAHLRRRERETADLPGPPPFPFAPQIHSMHPRRPLRP
ncbi:MAG TPA: hypothetical protein VHY79_00260 [Rhizomicrobium sp.]|jgi:hypothetical protein|nr:hypothetical protein [Rhizomicrobium sp.]